MPRFDTVPRKSALYEVFLVVFQVAAIHVTAEELRSESDLVQTSRSEEQDRTVDQTIEHGVEFIRVHE